MLELVTVQIGKFVNWEKESINQKWLIKHFD